MQMKLLLSLLNKNKHEENGQKDNNLESSKIDIKKENKEEMPDKKKYNKEKKKNKVNNKNKKNENLFFQIRKMKKKI